MATIKEIALKRSDIFYVDPRVLKVKPGWNARSADDPDNAEWIKTLARSIAFLGVQEPLTVYREDNEIYVSDGHCRLAATMQVIAQGVDIKSVPIKTKSREFNEAEHVFGQLLTDGKAKTPYEAGQIYKRLIGFGWTVAMIAEKSGRHASTINAALDLQGAPVAAQRLVASGKVSATLAARTLRTEGAAKGTQTLHDAVDTATQKGKARATAADIGEAPVAKLTAAGKLARIREIVDEAEEQETGDETEMLAFSLPDYRELLKLLGL